MALILINALLAAAWAAVTGNFGILNVLFGFVLGGVALALIREEAGAVTHFRRLGRATKLTALFLYELIKANFSVAVLVLSPGRELRPAIFAMPLDVESDAEITLLANLITLTPGTLSVDVSDDRKTLYVHAIDAPDPDVLIEDIKTGFEKRIIEVFRL